MIFFIKTTIAVAIILIASELSKKSTTLAAMLLAMPIVLFVSFALIYQQNKDNLHIAKLTHETVLYILPVLPFLYLLSVYENQKLFISFNFILSYIFLSTYSSKLNLFSSLSEWPTWILGLIIIKLLLSKDYDFKSLYLMSFLLGTCFLIRENQLPGLLYLIFLTHL